MGLCGCSGGAGLDVDGLCAKLAGTREIFGARAKQYGCMVTVAWGWQHGTLA